MSRGTLKISLDERVLRQLEVEAGRQGLEPGELVSQAIEARVADVVRAAGREWMPRERWDALVRGEGCPMCADLGRQEGVDAYGYTVGDLTISRLRLAANQSVRGYCVLICHRHVREPYHLGRADARRFFEDLMRAAAAIDRVFEPIKLNMELLGNALPHLHCHIKPRYYGDAAPGAPIWQDQARHSLETAEYAELVERLREALSES